LIQSEEVQVTRTEHLLTIMAEECSEVAQRVSKALRFGVSEVQPGQLLTNAERIAAEFRDLLAAYEMLNEEGVLPSHGLYNPSGITQDALNAKKAKVEKFLTFSAGRGLVDGVAADPTVPHPEAK
jgi:adenylosuccinate lyase